MLFIGPVKTCGGGKGDTGGGDTDGSSLCVIIVSFVSLI